MSTTTIKVTPADAGRRMSLPDFEYAEVQEGKLYELGRGVVVVSDVPNSAHFAQVDEIRVQLFAYRASHPGRIASIGTGADCKILLDDLESERHPDILVYKTPAPGKGEESWSEWIPEIVVEVVSPGSEERDYDEKREEYLRFGVHEYWILDHQRQEVLVLRRIRGRWKERIVRPPEVYRTRELPGFEFSCAAVFEAARAVGG
jgi:Uma2 family endonuclease